jgi:4-hydroxy-tetrahydrodipicolinate reductase
MRLAVVGASGRMGRAVVALASADGIEIVCAVGTTDVGRDAGELAGIGPIGTCVVDGLAAVEHARADVVIDFSVPSATLVLAVIAAATGSAIVSGTTGLGEDAREALERASKRVAVLWEPNMSVGVHLLGRLVAQAVAALPEWDVEIVETHHHAKVDAPSGTALRLAEIVRAGRPTGRMVHGRQGKPGARGSDEIGMHALRGGDVVGDHVVHFLGGAERIELSHRATSRNVFAHGALRAARWIAARPAGFYALDDVLGAGPPPI